MTPTPTPRTDAEVEDLSAEKFSDLDAYIRMTKHARQLERENQTFRAAQKACEDCDAPRVDRIAELERELAELSKWREMIDREVSTLRVELAAERALADRLAVAIAQVLPAFGTGGDLSKAWAAWKEARSEQA